MPEPHTAVGGSSLVYAPPSTDSDTEVESVSLSPAHEAVVVFFPTGSIYFPEGEKEIQQ